MPDPSIPWGEGYEAILPSEADIICDEYKPYPGCKSWEKWMSIKGQARDEFAWRRRIPATTPTESARDLSAEVERLEAELRAMTERAENFGRALRSIAEYKGLYIDSEAFYATRKIARVAIANEGEKA
jgi:aspartate aminotransferase-like enzyme